MKLFLKISSILSIASSFNLSFCIDLAKELNLPGFIKEQDSNVYVLDTGCDTTVFKQEHLNKLTGGIGVTKNHSRIEDITKSNLGSSKLLESTFMEKTGNDYSSSHGTHVTGIVAMVKKNPGIIPTHIGAPIKVRNELIIQQERSDTLGRIEYTIQQMNAFLNSEKSTHSFFCLKKNLNAMLKDLNNKLDDLIFSQEQLLLCNLSNLPKTIKDEINKCIRALKDYQNDLFTKQLRKTKSKIIHNIWRYLSQYLENNCIAIKGEMNLYDAPKILDDNSLNILYKDLLAKQNVNGSIINMSFGASDSINSSDRDCWLKLIKKGYTIVNSLGNDGILKKDNSSGFYKDAINFITELKKEGIKDGVNYEKQIIFVGGYHYDNNKKTSTYDIAGGELANYTIYAPAEIGSYVPKNVDPNMLQIKCGTSMAAPVIAGMLSNLIETGLNAQQARDVLFDTVAYDNVSCHIIGKSSPEYRILNVVDGNSAINKANDMQKQRKWDKMGEIEKEREKEKEMLETECENKLNLLVNIIKKNNFKKSELDSLNRTLNELLERYTLITPDSNNVKKIIDIYNKNKNSLNPFRKKLTINNEIIAKFMKQIIDISEKNVEDKRKIKETLFDFCNKNKIINAF